MFFTTSNARDVPNLGTSLLLTHVLPAPTFTMFYSGSELNAVYMGMPKGMSYTELLYGPPVPRKEVPTAFIRAVQMQCLYDQYDEILRKPEIIALYHYLEYFGISNPYISIVRGPHRFVTVAYDNCDVAPFIATIPELNVTVLPYDAPARPDIGDRIYIGKVHDLGISFKPYIKKGKKQNIITLPFKMNLKKPNPFRSFAEDTTPKHLFISIGIRQRLRIARFIPKRFRTLGTALTNEHLDFLSRDDFIMAEPNKQTKPAVKQIDLEYSKHRDILYCTWHSPFYYKYVQLLDKYWDKKFDYGDDKAFFARGACLHKPTLDFLYKYVPLIFELWDVNLNCATDMKHWM
jgi:hypothetical protein